ncbi:MAG: 16S rRNA (guanine(527)-N(7))-methyltransferase RsmG [Rhodospirillales bacterium]|nr:16S rRNA (guanine(527)-N(7))-methyltransferase RsmG [Rhodospirillales bacterium]
MTLTEEFMTFETFKAETQLPEDLLNDLKTYVSLLEKWQKQINLVSTPSLADVWSRHILDSLQIYPLIPAGAQTVVDLGSGAGFPGMVTALFAKHYGGPQAHLVEADSRKCSFLNEVNSQTAAGAHIHCCRVEAVTDLQADVVTARALAPLRKLLKMAVRFETGDTTYIFPKGEKARQELTDARKEWTMDVLETPSKTLAAATVLTLKGVSRRA